MSNVRTIQAHEGLTEAMIVSAANRISYSVPGDESKDLREMYAGQPSVNTSLLLCAAKTYLKMRDRNFSSERHTKATVREMKAIK